MKADHTLRGVAPVTQVTHDVTIVAYRPARAGPPGSVESVD